MSDEHKGPTPSDAEEADAAMSDAAMSDAAMSDAAHPDVEGELARAETSDDPERLKVLEELYGSLEGELEGDLDQEGSPRR